MTFCPLGGGFVVGAECNDRRICAYEDRIPITTRPAPIIASEIALFPDVVVWVLGLATGCPLFDDDRTWLAAPTKCDLGRGRSNTNSHSPLVVTTFGGFIWGRFIPLLPLTFPVLLLLAPFVIPVRIVPPFEPAPPRPVTHDHCRWILHPLLRQCLAAQFRVAVGFASFHLETPPHDCTRPI